MGRAVKQTQKPDPRDRAFKRRRPKVWDIAEVMGYLVTRGCVLPCSLLSGRLLSQTTAFHMPLISLHQRFLKSGNS